MNRKFISSCGLHLRATLLLLLATVNIAVAVAAGSENVQYLYLWNIDGSQTAWELTEHPKIIVDTENNQIICKAKTQDFYFDIDKISKYTLEVTEPNSLINGKTEDRGILTLNSNRLFLTGFIPESKVYIYTIDAKLVNLYTINSEGSLTIDIANLPNGIYIIKTDITNYKIIKR